MDGYAGRRLFVDLSEGDITTEELDEELVRETIGGRILNTWSMYQDLAADTDPLGAENVVYVATGPLTGSLLPTSAYTTVSARSPLTGLLGDSAAGGHFGPQLKAAGYDQLVVEGASERPRYLLVTDEEVRLEDASHLWGKDIRRTELSLREELGDHEIQVAAIGPAGENMVNYATIATNMAGRTFGRTGMGAVWGSKKLKALVVKGERPVKVARPDRYRSLCKDISKSIEDHPEYEKRNRLGTTMLVKSLHDLGILPTRHFQKGICEYVDRISGERLRDRYVVKNKSCFNCNVHCSRYVVTPFGEGEGPEFEPLCSYTSRIENDDLERALKLSLFMNRQGIDAISSGETIAWAMECVERGLLDKGDFDGLDFRFGELGAVEKILGLIAKRKGIGDLFAEGTEKLARHFGGEAEKYAMHTKGLDIINGDPRGLKAYGLGYAVASRGGDHLRADPFFELTGRKEEARERFGTEKAAFPHEEEGKPQLVAYSELNCLLIDSLTMCKNVGQSMEVMNPGRGAQLLEAATGLPFDEEELIGALNRARDRERKLNLRFGLDTAEDTLPERFKSEPLAEGPAAGRVNHVDEMVREYYRVKGWSVEGVPRERG